MKGNQRIKEEVGRLDKKSEVFLEVLLDIRSMLKEIKEVFTNENSSNGE